jgi:multidrug efflux system membrane fusion protein
MRTGKLTAAAAIGLMTAACHNAAPPPPAPQPPAVTVTQPLEREVTDWDEYPGRMEAAEMVEIKARVSGYLESINFKDGAEVAKGDLLFVIDPRPYQAALDMANAALLQAQTHLELTSNDLARAERMLQSHAISEEETDTRRSAHRMAAAEVTSAQASVETAQLNLGYSRITAPISGRIGRRLMTEGNLVNGDQGQSSLLATIMSLDPIYCYFEADERSALKYQKLAREGKSENMRDGKIECEIGLANEAGFPHRGVLDFVDNQVDPAMGTLRLRGVFANADRVLQPGFFARARVPGSAQYRALLIPDQAVGADQDLKYVLTVDEGGGSNKVQFHPVTLGPLVDGLRVVRTGLASNDWVAVNGLMGLRPGMTVTPQKAAAAAAAGATTTTARANN